MNRLFSALLAQVLRSAHVLRLAQLLRLAHVLRLAQLLRLPWLSRGLVGVLILAVLSTQSATPTRRVVQLTRAALAAAQRGDVAPGLTVSNSRQLLRVLGSTPPRVRSELATSDAEDIDFDLVAESAAASSLATTPHFPRSVASVPRSAQLAHPRATLVSSDLARGPPALPPAQRATYATPGHLPLAERPRTTFKS